MAAPAAQSYIDGIVAKLSYTNKAAERLRVQVPAFWMQQAIQSANITVIALRTMLDAIDLELGNLDEVITVQPEGDWHQRMSARLQALRQMQSTTQTQLTLTSMSSSGAPAFGLMTATVPIPSPAWGYDANAPRYKGDPNCSPWWMQGI